MNKVNLTLFVNENKKTNPLAPPYTNSKFQPKQDIVLKADTVYEMSLFKNNHSTNISQKHFFPKKTTQSHQASGDSQRIKFEIF